MRSTRVNANLSEGLPIGIDQEQWDGISDHHLPRTTSHSKRTKGRRKKHMIKTSANQHALLGELVLKHDASIPTKYYSVSFVKETILPLIVSRKLQSIVYFPNPNRDGRSTFIQQELPAPTIHDPRPPDPVIVHPPSSSSAPALILDFNSFSEVIREIPDHEGERLIDLGASLELINYHLARCIPARMLHELSQITPIHGLQTDKELNTYFNQRIAFQPQARALYNSKKANKRKRTAEMLKDQMYKTAAVEMFHQGVLLARKETLELNPQDVAHSYMDRSNGWCSNCKKHHIESRGSASFSHPSECPKTAKPIIGIFIDGDSGGNSIFGGHENMVGKRISTEFAQLQHRKTLSMITDEANTSQKCLCCYSQIRKAVRNIYPIDGQIQSKASRGTFICSNPDCHANTMSRDLMSSELMGHKAITASLGYPLAPLAKKSLPKSYQNAENALALLLQISTSLQQDLVGTLERDFNLM